METEVNAFCLETTKPCRFRFHLTDEDKTLIVVINKEDSIEIGLSGVTRFSYGNGATSSQEILRLPLQQFPEIWKSLDEFLQYQFWASLSEQLEICDYPLKFISLRIICALFNADILPGAWTFYLIDVAFCVLEHLLEKKNKNVILFLSPQLSAFIGGLGSILQGEDERILKTAFVACDPIRLNEWLARCDIILRDVQLNNISQELYDAVLAYAHGCCLMLAVYEKAELTSFCSTILETMKRFCSNDFLKSASSKDKTAEIFAVILEVGEKCDDEHGILRNFTDRAVEICDKLGAPCKQELGSIWITVSALTITNADVPSEIYFQLAQKLYADLNQGLPKALKAGISTAYDVDAFENFEMIISIAALLLKKIDPSTINSNNFELMALLLCLPWLQELFQNFKNLTIADKRELLQLSIDVEKNLGVAAKKCCLHWLSRLPEYLFAEWRADILCQCLISEDAVLVTAALDVLPDFVFRLGLPVYRLFVDIAIPMLVCQGLDVGIVRSLIRCIGRCCCVMAGTTIEQGRGAQTILFCTAKPGKRDKISDHQQFDSTPFLAISKLKISGFDEITFLELTDCLRHLYLHCAPDEDLIKFGFSLVLEGSEAVRNSFAHCIGAIGSVVESSALTKVVHDQLMHSYQRGLNDASNGFMILYLGQLARYNAGSLGEVALVCLITDALPLGEHTEAAVSATSELRAVCEARRCSLRRLYGIYTSKIIKKLIHNCIDFLKKADDQRENSNAAKIVQAYFERAATFFGYVRPPDQPDVAGWIRKGLRYIMPCLMLSPCPESSLLHKVVSSSCGVNRQSLICENVRYILVALVLTNLDEQRYKAVQEFIENEGAGAKRMQFDEYITYDLFPCVYELLIHLAAAPDSIMDIFLQLRNSIMERENTIKRIEGADEKKQVVDFLQPRLLGCLTKFEHKFVTFCPLHEKVLALKSLTYLMTLCRGDFLDEISSKMMSTLRAAAGAVDDRTFRPLLATAWLTLLKNVRQAENVALPAFVAVTQFMTGDDDSASIVEPVLKYIFTTKKSDLKEQIDNIAFLSTTIDFDILKNHVSPSVHSKMPLKDLIMTALKLVRNEQPDAKRLALAKLKWILRKYSASINELILDLDNVDDAVIQLVSTLTSCLRHTDADVRRLAAVCLGDLGAVDHGRLRLNSSETAATKSACVFADFDEKSVEFPKVLIQEMTQLLLSSSNGRFYDMCSWTLQEILRFYGCNENKDVKKTFANQLWTALDEATRKIVAQFLTTRYICAGQQNISHNISSSGRSASSDESVADGPLFGSDKFGEFKSWLSGWLNNLISEVEHEKAKQLFTILSWAAGVDVNFGQFLLPQVILRRLLEGNDTVSLRISDELRAALKGVGKKDQPMPDLNFQRSAAYMVFGVMDFLNKWLMSRKDTNQIAGVVGVENFLNKIEKNVASARAKLFDAHPRALMYYETFLWETSHGDKRQYLHELQEIYAQLNDVDCVVGVVSVLKKSSHSPDQEQLLALEVTGNYTEALPYLEAAISNASLSDAEKKRAHTRLINCLLRLNHTSVCRRYLNDLSRTDAEWEKSLHHYRVEALSKLQDWSALENELQTHSTMEHSWTTDVSKLLLAARTKDCDMFNDLLKSSRDHVLEKLIIANRDNTLFDSGYNYALCLHQLSEIEQGAGQFFNLTMSEFSYADSQDEMLAKWKQRLRLPQQSIDVLYSILDLRKQILQLGPSCEKTKRAVGDCWLEAAKIARKSGHLQSAWSFLVKAKEFDLVDTFVEEAKLLWAKDDKAEAMSCLKLGIQSNYIDILGGKADFSILPEDRKFCFAKAQLLFANYCREAGALETKDIDRLYSRLSEVYPQWEDAHYYIALHYDIFVHFPSELRSVMRRIQVMKYYAQSLEFGSRYLHHSMPRLLTIWLDLTDTLKQKASEADGSGKPKISASEWAKLKKSVDDANLIMQKALNTLPLYQFYSCFSQLISRICHPCEETFEVLKMILARLLATYPRQCVWMIISVMRSSVKEQKRKPRCQEIVKAAIKENSEVNAIVKSVDKLSELLINVCSKSVNGNVCVLSMKQDFKELFDFFNNADHSRCQIILPLQSFMNATFPTPAPGRVPSSDHKPFNDRPVCIRKFLDRIEVFNTLQKPKKIFMEGTDGRTYAMMCKPHDDLRLDKRLMEFTNLVNSCLMRDTEARRRELHIRTYTVTPLNDGCGLVEWVPNLMAMREAYLRMCREHGKKIYTQRDVNNIAKNKDSEAEKMRTFDYLVKEHPPLFKHWFTRTFPDPNDWYRARTNYVRTTAVMSMVGFILGLGDRHGENILMDRTNGDLVHVDFNCLFNRGESLEVPERVPFRLTHNMVDAMGPLGYEGAFRKTCEVTLKLMRDESAMLRTVLETFVHDPLVEWQYCASTAGKSGMTKFRPEMGGEKAKSHLNNIDLRLKGRVKSPPGPGGEYGLPLSVEGQVNVLIQQSTDNRILAAMYLGWAPFM